MLLRLSFIILCDFFYSSYFIIDVNLCSHFLWPAEIYFKPMCEFNWLFSEFLLVDLLPLLHGPVCDVMHSVHIDVVLQHAESSSYRRPSALLHSTFLVFQCSSTTKYAANKIFAPNAPQPSHKPAVVGFKLRINNNILYLYRKIILMI